MDNINVSDPVDLQVQDDLKLSLDQKDKDIAALWNRINRLESVVCGCWRCVDKYNNITEAEIETLCSRSGGTVEEESLIDDLNCEYLEIEESDNA